MGEIERLIETQLYLKAEASIIYCHTVSMEISPLDKNVLITGALRRRKLIKWANEILMI